MADGGESGVSTSRTCHLLLLLFLIVDFAIIVILAILGLLLGVFLRQPPVALGFFCDDETIRYPAKDDTFSTDSTILASLFIPLFLFVVQEVWSAAVEYKACVKADAKTVVWFTLKHFLRIVYLELMVILALMVTSILTEVGKIYGGQHRPWFLLACNPDFSKINCTDQFGNPLLIDESNCRPNDTTALIEARKSWPSGHASTIFCGMILSLLVVYYMPTLKASIGIRVSAMMALFAFAVIVGLSRISDYFHRWFDVISGAILGSAISVFVFYSFMYKDKTINWLRKNLGCEEDSSKKKGKDEEHEIGINNTTLQ